MVEVAKQGLALLAGAPPALLVAVVAIAGFTVVGLALWVVFTALRARR